MFNRLLDWLSARTGSRRVSSGVIVDSVQNAATTPRQTLEHISQIGMSAAQAMFYAVMVFPKLVATRARTLSKLNTALTGARAAHQSALVQAERYLQRPDLPALAAARAALDSTRYTLATALRAVHVTGALYWVVLVMLFGFDSWVFFTMYLDLFDADPANQVMYLITVITSACGALVTPMAVLWAADQAGARFARLNVEFCLWLDDEERYGLRGVRFVSMFLKGIILVGIVLAISTLFVLIAVFRFGEDAGAIGAVHVPVWLIATIMGLVPMVATGFAYSRRDPVAAHRRSVDAAWAKHEKTMAGNASLIQSTLLTWEEAWRALHQLVCDIVAESNLSIQHVEQLIVHALDRAGFGGDAPFRAEVRANQFGTSAARQASLDGAAASGYGLNAPAQLSSVDLPVPPWVQDALEETMRTLALNLPGAENRIRQEVADVLFRAFAQGKGTPSELPAFPDFPAVAEKPLGAEESEEITDEEVRS